MIQEKSVSHFSKKYNVSSHHTLQKVSLVNHIIVNIVVLVKNKT